MPEVEESLLEALAALSRLLEPRPDGYGRLAKLAHQVVRGCDHASVSLLADGGSVVTAGASDDLTIVLDDAQYEIGEGPCLSAILGGMRVRVDDFAGDDRFPRFGARAVAEGVASCLSLPVALRGDTIGGLNLYAKARRAYTDASVVEGEEVALQVALLVMSTRGYERSLRLVDQVQVAMNSRAEIEQAKGILMVRSHCDADRAFDILRRASQRQNVKLRQIAHTIVINTAAGLTSMTPDDRA